MSSKERGFSQWKALVVQPRKPLVITLNLNNVITIQPSHVTTIHSSRTTAVEPVKPQMIERPKRAAWDDRGWRMHNDGRKMVYEGFYRVQDNRGGRLEFAGRIEQTRWQIIPYIAHPPQAVRNHAKWACFSAMKAPWYRINWYRSPDNVDDCILYVERILDEAINGRKTKEDFWKMLFGR